MILIADSGSTKTEWALIDQGKEAGSFLTSGINPFFQTADDIESMLRAEQFAAGISAIDSVYFYGAGCANEEKNAIVKEGISRVVKAVNYEIGSDLLAAARSLCQGEPGVACILGTGSNSCLYNGKDITMNVSPLGFILGDEGSGAVLGRMLVSDVLKNQLPKQIIDLFYEKYKTSRPEIQDRVYKQPFPNRYLAQYTRFLSENIDKPEIERIVVQGFDSFIKRNLLQYPGIETQRVHFTGSVAFYFGAQLKKVMNNNNLVLGKIVKAPMEDLINYHRNNQ
jgi:N-acetylglucosamine kinase-like BadF-type ATPase